MAVLLALTTVSLLLPSLLDRFLPLLSNTCSTLLIHGCSDVTKSTRKLKHATHFAFDFPKQRGAFVGDHDVLKRLYWKCVSDVLLLNPARSCQGRAAVCDWCTRHPCHVARLWLVAPVTNLDTTAGDKPKRAAHLVVLVA